MQTLIFADRKQNSLGPLDRNYSPAMLPVAGREVIVHTIEDLVNAGIRHAYIVISSQAYEIEQLLGDGSRWGIKLEYILSRGEESPSLILKRMGNKLAEQLLLVRGDILRSPITREFIERISNIDSDVIHANINKRYIGLAYYNLSKITPALDKLAWPLHKRENTTDKVINFDNMSISTLENIDDVYYTSKAITANNFNGIKHAGYKTEHGYIHGRNHKLSKSSKLSEVTCIGDNVLISDNVKIEGQSIINDNVMIDNGARIKDSVIFPDTYIGSNTNIENSIVVGNEIYKIETGKSVQVRDDFLLSSLSGNSPLITDRLTGIILLLLSLPLWPIAALLAYMTSPSQALQSTHIISNRKAYIDNNTHTNFKVRVYEWNVSIPVLRNLPWILCVISGDLRLIGANPEFITDGPVIDLMHDQLDIPQLGLISTATLELPSKTPDFEKRVHELVYDKKRSFTSDLIYMLSSVKSLLARSTWRYQS